MLTALGQISAMGAMWNKQNVHLDLQMDFETVNNSSASSKTSPKNYVPAALRPFVFHPSACMHKVAWQSEGPLLHPLHCG